MGFDPFKLFSRLQEEFPRFAALVKVILSTLSRCECVLNARGIQITCLEVDGVVFVLLLFLHMALVCT